jgi:polyisoprenoid-binding protein YceI
MSTTRPLSPAVTVPGPGRYRIDPDRSTIAVRTKHLFGLGTVHATFALRSGEIIVADRVENSRVGAVAGAASFDSQNPGRDKRVRSSALLNADAHPEISFVSGSVSETDGTWTVRGTLTAGGEQAPLELTVTDAVARPDGLTIVATGTVDRYAHGITGAKGLAGRHLELTVTAVAGIGTE